MEPHIMNRIFRSRGHSARGWSHIVTLQATHLSELRL